ncbi:MAG: chromophore lyase CpcT/CpeT [Cyanobacteria bacterium SID2]|nr:chromophore lyase CpcT/CpeT [Cyanobacteria bacterium SID2]
MKRHRAIALGWVLAGMAGTAAAVDRPVDEVAAFLIGAMDSSVQAMFDRGAPDVRIVTCNVEVPDGDSSARYLYQEQALSLRLGRPYRQRFLKLFPIEDGNGVASLAFRPENTEQWVGLCDRPREQRNVQFEEFGDAICQLNLYRDGEIYRGATPESGCPTNYGGAVRITNTVELSEATMETWDRGFDENGMQVWGAEDRSDQFRDINPTRQDPEANAVVQWLSGEFRQVDGEGGYRNCTVLPAGLRTILSVPTDRDDPRLLQILRNRSGQLEILVYSLTGDWENFCDRDPSRRLIPTERMEAVRCRVPLRFEENTFVGSISSETCLDGQRDMRLSRESLEIRDVMEIDRVYRSVETN